MPTVAFPERDGAHVARGAEPVGDRRGQVEHGRLTGVLQGHEREPAVRRDRHLDRASLAGRPPACPAAASVPSTAPAVPASARATLITSAPLPSATSRYLPSGVTAAPAGPPAPEDGSGTDLTTVTAGADPVPFATLSRSTATDPAPDPDPPAVAANAHRPSGVAATPNGALPAATDVVPAGPSARPAAVAPEQPGDASACPVSAGTAAVEAAPEAGVAEAADLSLPARWARGRRAS